MRIYIPGLDLERTRTGIYLTSLELLYSEVTRGIIATDSLQVSHKLKAREATDFLSTFKARGQNYAERFIVREDELCFGHSAGLVGDCQGTQINKHDLKMRR